MLQWAGPAATAVYVHIKCNEFEYKGCFGADEPARPSPSRQRVGCRVTDAGQRPKIH